MCTMHFHQLIHRMIKNLELAPNISIRDLPCPCRYLCNCNAWPSLQTDHILISIWSPPCGNLVTKSSVSKNIHHSCRCILIYCNHNHITNSPDIIGDNLSFHISQFSALCLCLQWKLSPKKIKNVDNINNFFFSQRSISFQADMPTILFSPGVQDERPESVCTSVRRAGSVFLLNLPQSPPRAQYHSTKYPMPQYPVPIT